MADLFTLEDDLYDLYEGIINNTDIPLIFADDEEGVEESTRSGATYVTIELGDTEQVGTVYRYPNFSKDEKSFQKSRTEWIFPLIFTSYGDKSREALTTISLAHNSWGGLTAYSKSGIALRRSGAVTQLPRISGASKERGAMLTLEMGITNYVTTEIQLIETTEVTGVIDTGRGFKEIVTVSELQSYLEVHGYEITEVIKDYSKVDSRWDHTIDLGLLGDPITETHDAGLL